MSITAKQFKNFSNTAFSWKFDGIEYTFPAGTTMYMEDFKADHFAKHLIDRELNAQNVVTDNKVARAKMLALCFPSAEVVTPNEALNIEETKKAVTKGKKAAKKVADEGEFEELNEK